MNPLAGHRTCAKAAFRSRWQSQPPSRHSSVDLKPGTRITRTIFAIRSQWTPVIIAPMLMIAGVGAVRSSRVAHTVAPCHFRRGDRGWSRRFWLPRAWCLAAPGRLEKAALQHHLRAAAVCAVAVCGQRPARIAGQPAAEREMKTRSPKCEEWIRVRSIPVFGKADWTDGAARILSGLQHARDSRNSGMPRRGK